MKLLHRLLRAIGVGHHHPHASRSPAAIDTLEGRTLFAAGPSLVGETLLGSAQAVTGVVLTFNQPLDVGSAQDVNSYVIGRHVSSGSDDGGLLGGLFPFTDRPGQVDRPENTGIGSVLRPDRKGVKGGRIGFTSAVYDDSTMSVTLTPAYPIKATKFFRYIHVSGMGDTAVTNTLGQPVVGNDGGVGNIRIDFRSHQNKSLSFTDASGNRVSLKLKGPGTIVSFLRTGADPQPIVLLEGTYAGESTLTGSVKAAKGNADVTDLQELLGVSNCDASAVTSNPQFVINAVEP